MSHERMFDNLLDKVERAIEDLEAVHKRSRPSTNNPLDDALMSSAYDSPINDLDEDDDGDADEAPGYDGEDWDGDDGNGDDDNGDDDDGDYDEDDDEAAVEHPRHLRKLAKVYGRTSSTTSGTNTPPPMTHKWAAKVRHIQARDKVTPAEATRRARVENPVLYADYQRSGLKGNARHQDLIADEVRKGFNPTVAAQRVLHLYGSAGAPDLMKGDTLTTRFMRCVDKVIKRHPGMSRMEAMQAARERNPRLFARFQNV
jgi:hypothetical protein